MKYKYKDKDKYTGGDINIYINIMRNKEEYEIKDKYKHIETEKGDEKYKDKQQDGYTQGDTYKDK